jgi:type II secretory pathway pseudopilin PulG
MKIGRRRELGFTLAEVAVSAAIVAMLAAVTIPYLVTFLDKQRVQATADKLAALTTGIAAFATGVHTAAALNTNTYPGTLSELTTQIQVGTPATHNSCGSGAIGNFNAHAGSDWSTNGPFLSFFVPVGGLQTPMGLVADSLVRTPLAATAGTLGIRMVAVDTADANLLDLIVDGGDGGVVGTVRFVVNGVTHLADIQYIVPVPAKC